MKRIFCWSITSLLMISLLVACSEDIRPETSVDVADVVFNLNVEGETAEVRAISDGTGVDQLMWAVFGEDGELVHPKSVKNNVTDLLSANGHSMYVTLAKGKTRSEEHTSELQSRI